MADLSEIHKMLGSFEAKLDQVAVDITEIKSTVRGHEALKNYVIGICAAISAAVGFITSKISG